MDGRWRSVWFDRAPPVLGQVAIWILLAAAVVIALWPIPFGQGSRGEQWVSVLSWLDHSISGHPATINVARGALLAAAVCWLFNVAQPWSAWVTALAFTVVWALRTENVSSNAHTMNIPTMLLWLHVAWIHLYRDEIAAARRQHRFWVTPLYPRWVFLASVFYIGWFHTLAGVSKLVHAGPMWGDGLSLQLWVSLFAWQESPAVHWIMSNRPLAMVLQNAVLVLETSAIVCILGRPWRYLIGFGLVVFYLGVLTTFVMFGFHFNLLLVAWFLLPIDRRLLKWTPAIPLGDVAASRGRQSWADESG